MSENADIEALRREMDEINRGMARLFCERMELSARIAREKAGRTLPVRDPSREEAVLSEASERCPEELRPYMQRLFETLMELSREYQLGIINNAEEKDYSND